MVRNFDVEEIESLVIDVYLKDGQEYIGCDITQQFLGENETLLSFWVGNEVIIKPMDEVKGIKMRSIKEDKND